MTFVDFTRYDLQHFLQRERSADALWFFLHVPKTAGTSFGGELAKQAAPYVNVHIDYGDEETPYHVRLGEAVRAFAEQAGRRSVRSASGHIPFDLLEPLRATIPSVRFVTILRDAVRRVVSDYRYQRTPTHPPHRAFMERFKSIEQYVLTPFTQNAMTRMLAAGCDSDDFEELYAIIEGRFDFIGLLEMYPMSFNILFRMFGAGNVLPTEHRRRTEETTDNVVELTPELIRLISEKNWLDVALHARVRAALVAKRDEWVALRANGL